MHGLRRPCVCQTLREARYILVELAMGLFHHSQPITELHTQVAHAAGELLLRGNLHELLGQLPHLPLLACLLLLQMSYALAQPHKLA